MPKGKCPKCGHVSTLETGPARFYCHDCKLEFEAIDDGATTYGDPARIAARNERLREAERYRRKIEARKKLKGGLGRCRNVR